MDIRMQSTQQLLDGIRAELGLATKYALAKRLGVSQATVRNWYDGATHPDDTLCMVLAELMDFDPACVLALVHANRQKYSRASLLWAQLYELAKINAAGHGRRVP